MIPDLLCTTASITTAPTTTASTITAPTTTVSTTTVSEKQLAGGWRPLSTDPAIDLPALVAPAKRPW